MEEKHNKFPCLYIKN